MFTAEQPDPCNQGLNCFLRPACPKIKETQNICRSSQADFLDNEIPFTANYQLLTSIWWIWQFSGVFKFIDHSVGKILVGGHFAGFKLDRSLVLHEKTLVLGILTMSDTNRLHGC